MNAPRHDLLATAAWEEVRALFERCLALDAVARERLIAEATEGKPWLRSEVESLLAKSDAPDAFLGAPLIGRMGVATPPPPVGLSVAGAALPERLGKYLLFHRLGCGGMAEVFLAKTAGPNGFERLVAIKRILPGYAADPESRDLFEYEAKLSSRLVHSNIAPLYEFGAHDGAYLLVMEFVNGLNLAEVLRRARKAGMNIPVDIALHIVAKVADGLDYAHRRKDDVTGEPLGIVHRDIAPKNIMLSFDGDTKIVDFGIAKARDRVQLTQSGIVRGTVGYLSPEAAAGQPTDGRSDIFSLTAVLYELLAGDPLFGTGDVFAVLGRIRDGAETARRVEALPVDGTLKAILAGGLAQQPELRPSSAGKLRAELDAYLATRVSSDGQERLAGFLRTLAADEIAARRKVIEETGSAAVLIAQESSPKSSSVIFAPFAVSPAPSKRSRTAFRLGAAIAGLVLLGLVLFVVAIGGRLRRSGMVSAPSLPLECEEAAQRLCPGKTLGAGLGLCLIDHKAELSAPCRDWLGTNIP